MKITHIFRYPIKGLSAESLNDAVLQPGVGIPFDRYLAIAHGHSVFDFNDPQWVQRRNFLVVAHSPRLAALESRYQHDEGLLTLHYQGEQVFQADVRNPAERNALNEFFEPFIGEYQPGPYQIAEVPDTHLTDSPLAAISIMNLSSLRALQQVVGGTLDMRRFRGNLWFDSDQPWVEFDWVDKEIVIGEVRLKVIERIQRCAAINADPESGERDRNVLRILQDRYDHRDFGVLAEVIEGGSVTVGCTIGTT